KKWYIRQLSGRDDDWWICLLGLACRLVLVHIAQGAIVPGNYGIGLVAGLISDHCRGAIQLAMLLDEHLRSLRRSHVAASVRFQRARFVIASVAADNKPIHRLARLGQGAIG